jgi:electron transport complex protein RnfG
VLPGTSRKATFTVEKGVVEPLMNKEQPGTRVHAGYDSVGTLTGIAIEAQGQGFQDVLKILIGYDPACECVVGMKVLESKETPGLGDKIEKDERFRSNFDSLDVRLSPDGRELLERVVLVKKGEKNESWQVEAITGATISSRAIAAIVDASAAELLPVIMANLDRLKEGS